MSNKSMTGECLTCESSYNVEYMEEMVSQQLPEHCPFCGESIEELSEQYIDEDDNSEDAEKWE